MLIKEKFYTCMTVLILLLFIASPVLLFIAYKQSQRDYIVTCTSLLPDSKPVIYHVDNYSYPSRRNPNWKFTLLNGKVIKILPYTNDIKIQEVEENSIKQ